jgi:hypothetical protein
VFKVSLRTNRVKGVTVLAEKENTLHQSSEWCMQWSNSNNGVLMLLHNPKARYINCDYLDINNIDIFQLV